MSTKQTISTVAAMAALIASLAGVAGAQPSETQSGWASAVTTSDLNLSPLRRRMYANRTNQS
jgi:hypothetical protein